MLLLSYTYSQYHTETRFGRDAIGLSTFIPFRTLLLILCKTAYSSCVLADSPQMLLYENSFGLILTIWRDSLTHRRYRVFRRVFVVGSGVTFLRVP